MPVVAKGLEKVNKNDRDELVKKFGYKVGMVCVQE